MAVGFSEWTVLKHRPIDKFESNLWHVSGTMPRGNDRKMVLARRQNGEVVVFNAIALDKAEMAEIEAFGKLTYLVVPNGMHRQDAFIWKQRYPQLKVVAPRGAVEAVQKALKVDLTCEQFPRDDPTLQLVHPAGLGDKEAMMLVRHPSGGRTVVACDAILNLAAGKIGLPMSFLLAPVGTVSMPRLTRWMMLRDKAAFAAGLSDLAGSACRLIPGHGAVVEDGVQGLKTVIANLG